MAEIAHVVAAVIPVLDEVAAIGPLVRELRDRGVCCVVVVDGGSRDGTQTAAVAAGATLVTEPRRGYGRACLTGADHARRDHAIIAFLDGDGSCDPADLPVLLAALETADIALGRRVADRLEPGALPWHARLGNRLVATIIGRRTRRRVHDLSPFKALRRAALDVLDLDEPGFGWTVQLVTRALRARSLRVVEPPIAFRARRGGTSKVSGSWRASLAAGRQMLAHAAAESSHRPVVAVVAKAPRPGHVKTRLAAGIGEIPAVALWTACLEDLGGRLRTAGRARPYDTLAIVPALDDPRPVARHLGPGWEVVRQTRDGLGGAITDAILLAQARGATAAVVVSGDNPTLPTGRVDDALRALRDAPAVLGPCPDGGYHLIGVRLDPGRDPRDLGPRLDAVFAASRLGGGSAFESTRDALAAVGLPPVSIQPWADIDTAEDLVGLVDSVRAADADAVPATRAWLDRYADLVPAGPTAVTG